MTMTTGCSTGKQSLLHCCYSYSSIAHSWGTTPSNFSDLLFDMSLSDSTPTTSLQNI